MIGIVGAGITGLVLARELQRRGRTVRVWEAEDRPGGVIHSEVLEGRVLDFGPQRTRLTGPIAALVEDLDLESEILRAPEDLPLYVFRDGRLRTVPFTPIAALSTDLLSWRAKLRALGEPFIIPRRAGETVEDFFVRNFGREIYENLLGPLYGGLYASDPGEMPARHALARVLEEFQIGPSLLLAFLRRGAAAREAVPTITFRRGLAALPGALAEALGSDLRLGRPVDRVIQGPMGRVHVEVEGEGATEVEAVVLTCPAGAAGHILRQAAPMASEILEGLTYNPLAVVHLESECDLDGFGYQVAFGEEMETRGVTWNASIFGGVETGREGVFTAYLGGMKNPGIVDCSDDEIGGIAAREFEAATGFDAGVLKVSRTRIPAWDRSWNALDRIGVPAGVHLCSSYTGRPGIPGRVTIARSLAAHLAG